jgi:hypothetical protein
MGQTDGLKKARQMKKDLARCTRICARARWRRRKVEMAEETSSIKNEKLGEVVSTKMAKTIVVEVSRRVPHPLYKRIVTKRQEVLRPR